MSNAVSSNKLPDFVGRFRQGETDVLLPGLYEELDRSAVALAQMLSLFGFAPTSTVLVISQIFEVAQFGPIERAIQFLGMLCTNAESTRFDASRVESLCRQFDPPAVIGLSLDTIEGLRELGYDLPEIFEGRTVWTRPDAFYELQSLEKVRVLPMAFLGPVTAMSCPSGNLHYDDREWAMLREGDDLTISSRVPRFMEFSGYRDAFNAAPATRACGCGSKMGWLDIGAEFYV